MYHTFKDDNMSEEKMMVGMTSPMLDSILHLMCGGILECEENRSSEYYTGEMFKLIHGDDGFVLMECSPSRYEYEWQVSDLSVTDLFSMKFAIRSEYMHTFATMISSLLDDPYVKAYSEFDPDLAYKVEEGLLFYRNEGKDADPNAEWCIASVPQNAVSSRWKVVSAVDVSSVPPVVE